jgi:hypothetical protein
VLNVEFLELAIMRNAYSFVEPILMNTCRLLEIITQFIFLQNTLAQKLILLFLRLYGHLEPKHVAGC